MTKKRTATPLDDQLCFALYAATNAITRLYRPLLTELGLTYPQFLVLLVLWEHGPRRLGEIAADLELASHAVTPIVDRLEEAGLVTRTKDKADGRAVIIELTKAGAKLESDVAVVQNQVWRRTHLPMSEAEALRDNLREFVDRVREQ